MTFESLSRLDCLPLFLNENSEIGCVQWLNLSLKPQVHIKDNRRWLQGPSARGSLKFQDILTSISHLDHLTGDLMR